RAERQEAREGGEGGEGGKRERDLAPPRQEVDAAERDEKQKREQLPGNRIERGAAVTNRELHAPEVVPLVPRRAGGRGARPAVASRASAAAKRRVRDVKTPKWPSVVATTVQHATKRTRVAMSVVARSSPGRRSLARRRESRPIPRKKTIARATLAAAGRRARSTAPRTRSAADATSIKTDRDRRVSKVAGDYRALRGFRRSAVA